MRASGSLLPDERRRLIAERLLEMTAGRDLGARSPRRGQKTSGAGPGSGVPKRA
jgi:hypothetical protein